METAEITTKTVYLSKRGKKDIKKDINKLDQERRKLIRGLHELDKINNHDGRFERVERLARLDAVETNLDEKRKLLQMSQPLPRKRSRLQVALGSIVELMDRRGHHFIYRLVDSIEADPSHGRISVASPLGQHLIGRKASDTITLNGMSNQQMRLIRIS